MKELFKILEKLLKEGRGFDFQSHTRMNGMDYYNFALYWAPGTASGKRKTIYYHSHTLKDMAAKMKDFANEKNNYVETYGDVPKAQDIADHREELYGIGPGIKALEEEEDFGDLL